MSDKFQHEVKAGSTDISLPVLLRKTADNTEQTGKAFGDVTGSYWRQGGIRVAITMATLGSVNAAHSDGGFIEVDATNQPGLYRLDVPDLAFATGADWVIITVKVASTYVFHLKLYLTTNVIQAGDSFTRIGALGAGLTALAQSSAWTATRAGYVDKLNVTGTLAHSNAAATYKADVSGLALASVCTEARLAELGATNLPADVDTLLARLTAARAGYLDKLNVSGALAHSDAAATYKADVSALALASVCTEARLARLDAAITTRAATGAAMTLTSGERDAVAAAHLDLADGVETGFTVRQVYRVMGAACAAKLSGAATATNVIRNLGDTLNRISATVDADGNRSAVVFNLT